MTDKKVTVSKTVLQERAEANQRLREQARKNRAAKGVQTDAGVTFVDLPAEYRATHFAHLENTHKDRLNAKASQQYKERYSIDRGEPTVIRK